MLPSRRRSIESLVWFALVLPGASCRREPPPPTVTTLSNRIHRLVDSTVQSTPSIPGLILAVSTKHGVESSYGAAGFADRATKDRLTWSHTFRIASNTKSYVAAAVLRLMEDGKVTLADPIAKRISPQSAATLAKGGYDPARITVRQLLQHVSGIYDYATDPAFATDVLSHPDHRWTRPEQLQFAMAHGKSYGSPGTVYHYSDTGYILLGEILERETGQPLGVAVRTLLKLDRMSPPLRETWFETLDSVPATAGPRAHQYQDAIDIYAVDPSFDLWGGGGIVATIADLARFYRYLGTGQVFARKETLDTMEQVSAASLAADSTKPYAMGIARRRIGGVTCWGHGGHWGSVALYCPEIDVAIAIASNQSRGPGYDEMTTVTRALQIVRGDSAPPATTH